MSHYSWICVSEGLLDFAFSLFQGPVRVHCRRQLRSAPGRRLPGVLDFVIGGSPPCAPLFVVFSLWLCFLGGLSTKSSLLRDTRGDRGGNLFFDENSMYFLTFIFIDIFSISAPILVPFWSIFHDFGIHFSSIEFASLFHGFLIDFWYP